MKIKKILTVSIFLLVTSLVIFPNSSQVEANVSNWQNGATFFPKSTTMYSSDSFKRAVDQLADTGANYAGLMIPYYQSNPYVHDIQPGWNTPTDASLREGVDYIHSKGMRVFFVMKLDNLDGQWHAYIQPTNRDAWFTNFGNLLNKYAVMAEEKNVELYSLGVELWGVTSEVANYDNKARWQVLISNVKQRYSGLLTYGAQHSGGYSEKNQVSFWSDLDFIGLSAYYPLNSYGPTIEEGLYNSWENVNNNEIAPLYNTYHKPILFTELGYRNITNSHLEPWSYWSNANIDEQEQARNYEALFGYWDQFDYMMGWHVWAWEGDPNAGGPYDDSFTPQNKEAQAVLEKWWAGSTPDDPEPTPDDPAPLPDDQEGNNISITPNPVGLSQTVNISGAVVNNGTRNSSHMILFIFNSNWEKVRQKDYVNLSLGQGEATTFEINWTPETTGTYYVAVGLFDQNWQGVYWQDFTDPMIEVGNDNVPENPPDDPPPPPEDPPPPPDDPPPPPEDPPEDPEPPANDGTPELPTYDSNGFASLSDFSTDQSSVGKLVIVKSFFKSKNQLSAVNVDVEIFNSNWKQVHQEIFRNQNFSSDIVNEYSFNWTPSQPGTYHIKVGVFNSGWSNLYWFSQDDALLIVQ